MPIGTCLRLSVVDAIQCDWEGCEIPTRGSILLNKFQIIDNSVDFEIPCNGGNGNYYVS